MNLRRINVLPLYLSLLAVPWLAAAESKTDNLLSVEKLWQLDRIGQPAVSADGRHIVAPVTAFDLKEDRAQTQLWRFSADGRQQLPLTAKGLSVSEATFSPDGKTLAFISKRHQDDVGQIYLLPMDSPGEAMRLTEVPTGVSGLKWVGRHLYFISKVWPGLTDEETKARIKAEKDNKVSAKVWNALPYSHFDHFIDEQREAHVFRIAATGGAVEALTLPLQVQLPRATQNSDQYDVDADERYLAFNGHGAGSSVDPNIDIFLTQLGSKEVRNITPNNPAPDSLPSFSPDGKTLAYSQQRIHGFYADTARLVVYRPANDSHNVLTAEWDRSVTNFSWSADGRRFYSSIDDAGTNRLYSIDAKSGKPRAITQQTSFGKPVVAGKALVTTNDSFLFPARLVKVDAEKGKVTRLDSFNDDKLANVQLGQVESVTYQGHQGKPIQMWVHYPPGFDKTKKYPLFLLIHGGPHNAITDSFSYRWNAQTMASWGYVTAWPNFHGSSGFGQEFADSINPDWRTAPLADIQAATRWFENQPYIDTTRMVAGGASYGGYLTSILLGTEHPFKALLIHAAVYNMYSQMSADFAVHTTRFGNYWDKPEIYQQISPHYFAGKFNTPTLVTHGQLDYRVPVGQGFELFRTLQSRGVPSRMVYFPDENHWILKPNNSLYWHQQVKEWMTTYAAPGPR